MHLSNIWPSTLRVLLKKITKQSMSTILFIEYVPWCPGYTLRLIYFKNQDEITNLTQYSLYYVLYNVVKKHYVNGLGNTTIQQTTVKLNFKKPKIMVLIIQLKNSIFG